MATLLAYTMCYFVTLGSYTICYYVMLGPYTMCYCSVLLRSVMATLLAYWETSRERVANNSPQQLQTTVIVIRCMRLVRINSFVFVVY